MPKLSQFERFEPIHIRVRRFYKHLFESLVERTGKTQREFVESWIEHECIDEPKMKRYKRLFENFHKNLRAIEEGKGEEEQP